MKRLDHGMEVFARGVAFTRSFARPYVASKVAGAGWWLRDGEDSARRRNDEWIASADGDLAALDRIARERAGGRYLINVVASSGADEGRVRETLRGLGYRLWRTESLMTRSTAKVPECGCPAEIQAVESVVQADRLSEIAGGRLVLPEHLTARVPQVRCNVALVGDRIVGWARSVTVGRAGWCASMYVAPGFRRQGIGSALTVATLRADRSAELIDSVLVASHSGQALYATVGYALLGTVLVFVRKAEGERRKAEGER